MGLMTTRSISPAEGRAKAEGEWAKLSASMTKSTDRLAGTDHRGRLTPGRRDIVVTITPGAGHGHAACFVHGLAEIEIDGSKLEVEPSSKYLVPHKYWDDRDRIPATWGLLIHEVAHAVHTLWRADAVAWARMHRDKDYAGRVIEAAVLLEESRIEDRQLERRPYDKRYLRMMVTTHVMGEMDASEIALRYAAMRAVTLIGGRWLAGVLKKDETKGALGQCKDILGDQDYNDTLAVVLGVIGDDGEHGSGVWDTSWSAMQAKAEAWVEILERQEDPKPEQERLEQILQAAAKLAEEAAEMDKRKEEEKRRKERERWDREDEEPEDDGDGDEPEHGEGEITADRMMREAEFTPEERKLAKLLGEVIKIGGDIARERGWTPWVPEDTPMSFGPVWNPVGADQKRAADSLRDRMLEWIMPERSAGRVDSDMPPGRLNGRMAIQRAAERASGAIPTAEHWRSVQRKSVPTPPLRVGMIVDVSGSMSRLAALSREIAYRFGAALAALPDARFRGILAGEGTHPWPSKPGQVPFYEYHHGQEDINTAAEILIEGLAMMKRGSARLLIVISDGNLEDHIYDSNPGEQSETTAQLEKILNTGGYVLWISSKKRSMDDGAGWNHDERFPGYDTVPGVLHRLRAPTDKLTYVEVEGENAVAMAEDALIKIMRDTAGKRFALPEQSW